MIRRFFVMAAAVLAGPAAAQVPATLGCAGPFAETADAAALVRSVDQGRRAARVDDLDRLGAIEVPAR